jgi:phosphoribosylformimino-5-aminoimidazole carboxamide ribotide isomerase
MTVETSQIEVIPSMDFLNGRPVRLHQGDYSSVTGYDVDPVKRAEMWQELGATRYHMVNLTGAAENSCEDDWEIIESIIRALKIDVQIGGGVRTDKIIERLLSVRGDVQLILGTMLLTSPEIVKEWALRYGADRFIGDIGFTGDEVLIRGWQEQTGLSVTDAVSRIKDLGLSRLVLTNKNRDGAGTGPDLSKVSEVALQGIDVVISGGVSTDQHIEDISRLRENPRVTGLILGRRLYEPDGASFFTNALQKLQK